MRSLLILLLLTSPVLAQPYGFLSWTVSDGLPAAGVNALAEDTFGYLWVGTEGGGVARFDGKDFVVFATKQGLSADFIAQHYAAEGAAAGALNVEKAGVDTATVAARLHRLNPALPVFTALLPAGKNYLAGSAGGLYLLSPEGQVISHYTAPEDLPGTSVRALLTDRQGRHWIGTDNGIARMIPTGIRHFGRGADGLAGRRVSAIGSDNNGTIWLGLDRDGLQMLDSAGFARPPFNDPTRGAPITAIARDTAGRVFVATNGRGLAIIDPDSLSVIPLTTADGLPGDRLLTVLPAPDGSVWAISYDRGIGRIRYADSLFVVKTLGLEDGLPAASFTAALLLPGGELLLGTTDGRLLRWRPGKATTLGPENGLPAGAITALALRRETQLWVASEGNGLLYTDLRMDQPYFATPPKHLGDLPASIRQLLTPADRPEVWLGTDRSLEQIVLDRDGRPDWRRRYGRAEGFPAAATLPGAALFDEENGLLYFGTTDGLVRYTREDGDGYLAPPPTSLESINLFYEPLKAADYQLENGKPTFAAADNHFNFSFSAVDLTYPDRVRYQWRLSGVDPGWSPAARETTVRYAGLSPGHYRFQARATTDDGKTWGAPAEFSFAISSPLWRQGWFLGLATLLIAGLLVGGFYFFYHRIQRQEAAKRRQLETRNQLLTLEQKALQLQMNPHFLFNALNGIRGLVDGEHDAEARAQITRFATLMRGILNNSRRATIPLSEEISTLTDYLRMEQFCQAFDFTFTIVPPEDVDPEEVNIPSMLLQPFLENAVLHGLAAKTGERHIGVSFFMRGRGMQCLVTDTGIGRAAAAARQAARPAGHQSVALDVTRQRLQAMKGQLEISDLTDDRGEVAGTKVALFFPVEAW